MGGPACSHHPSDSAPINLWAHLYFAPLFLSAAACYFFSALGVTAGAHRLWSHRSYKASFPLRVFLALSNSMAFQVQKKKVYLFLVNMLFCENPPSILLLLTDF